jgi:hypothetical protein
MLADPYCSDEAAGDTWVNSYRGMFEFFLRANHSTTLGYQTGVDGFAAPLFGAPVPDNEKNEIERKQEAIMAFVERYCRLEALIGRGLADALQLADKQLRSLLERPTRKEAAVFATYRHSEQQVEREFTQMVCIPRTVDVFARRTSKRFGIWAEGSFALSKVPSLFRLRQLVVGMLRRLYL